MLNQEAPPNPQRDLYDQSASTALDTLRLLGTPEAIRDLAHRLRPYEFGNAEYRCALGLISAPEPALARESLGRALVDPDHPIDREFLNVLQVLDGDSKEHAYGQRQQVLQELVAALPKKRGVALAISLTTAVNEAWNGVPLAASTTEALVRQLIARFDQLPPRQQSELLGDRWNKIGGPALLPILRRYATAFDDHLDRNSPTGQAAIRVSMSALQHWYELDPVGARPAILNEITRPHPRYDARVLGLLPDKTLPEIDSTLAEHLTASDGMPQSGHLASLIARYATDAILPTVLATLDPPLGRWACDVQTPLLAYVLRVRSSLAQPRIERALAARGRGFSGCYRALLLDIAVIHYDPLLESLAVRGLDDPDARVRSTSATLLGRFGSPAAESVLLDHYKSWSETRVGRGIALNPTLAAPPAIREEAGVGFTLLQALTTGQSWLTDGSQLRSLLATTEAVSLRTRLESEVRIWDHPPLVISATSPGSLSFVANVAQYELGSVEALEDKLAQFPAGTRFQLRVSGPDSPAKSDLDAKLRAFLSDHKMVVPSK